MSEDVWIVDAFTTKPFLGNAAGVCLLDSFPDDSRMQAVATQMQLSETAFLVRTSPLHYHLRWFTPTVEVNLCGHATLAATHVLRKTGQIKPGDTVTYATLSGDLTARALEGAIELDFPTLPGEPAKPHAALRALGVEIVNCEKNRDNYLVEVKDYDTLAGCRPNFEKLEKMDMQGVIVTTATGVEGYDFASRYFAPNCGIDEDPVTGSTHCFLAPYWAKRLGKNQFHAYQASKGRGVLDVTLSGERTLIAGSCVTTLKGKIPTPPARTKEKVA